MEQDLSPGGEGGQCREAGFGRYSYLRLQKTLVAVSDMRVGHFYRDYLARGGMPRETKLLAEAMQRHTDQVFIYCYTGDRDEEGDETTNGVIVRKFWFPHALYNWCWFFVPGCLRRLLAANSDSLDALLITGTFVPENAAIARLARTAGIPYVISIGAGLDPLTLSTPLKKIKKRLFYRLCERSSLTGAAGLRLYSWRQLDDLASWGCSNPVAPYVVKEGIDWHSVSHDCAVPGISATQAGTYGADGLPVFGFLGRLAFYDKGLDILLRAWAHYESRDGRGFLFIAGPGSARERRELQRLQDQLRLARVKVLPALYGVNKARFFRTITALVLPSRHEGIPRVLREAIAFKTPIIATEHTNLCDIIEQTKCGLVARLDPADLAEKIRALAESTDTELESFRQGAETASKVLNWDTIAKQYLSEVAARVQRV